MENKVRLAEEERNRSVTTVRHLESTCKELKDELEAIKARAEADVRNIQRQLESSLDEKSRLGKEVDEVGRSREDAAREFRTTQDSLEERLRKNSQQLTSTLSERDDLQAKLLVLESELSEYKAANARLETNVKAEHNEYEIAATRAGGLENQLADMDKELAKLRELLEQSTLDLAAETSKLSAVRQEASELHGEKMRLGTELDGAHSRIDLLEKTETHLEGQLQRSESTLTAKSTALQSLQEEFDSLKRKLVEELNAERTQTASLTQKNGLLEQQNADLTSQIETLRNKLGLAEAEVERLAHELKRLQDEFDQAKSKHRQELDALQAELARKNSELEALRLRSNELQTEIDAQNQQLAKMREELSTLRSKMERDLAEAEARYKALQAKQTGEAESNGRQIAALEAQIKALKAEIAQAGVVESELRKTVDESQSSLREATSTLTQLNFRHQQLEMEHGKLTASHLFLRRSRAYTTFREFIRIARAIEYTAVFFRWRTIAQDGAIHRGAAELKTIVDNATSLSPKHTAEQDEWDIDSLDIQAIAAGYGL
eukprot:TRINITY_DN15088_c0_g1_i4.p1 TRINITY_DN15088_c0_g1~~TRINITY_DN15088_c0_g1_i4.p1  ORF type:complete len:548 (-),score=233.11 TRINITY_DN15088_c0_g1_i4:358-2001(-)